MKIKTLYSQNPKCYWCGRVTKLGDRTKMEPISATIDHIYSKLTRLTKGVPEGDSKNRVVLACRQCNSKRNYDEWMSLTYNERVLYYRLMKKKSRKEIV